jgi:hypothetical protein
MKTIVWKELREHGFWVPLALITTSLVTWWLMHRQDLLLNRIEVMASTVFSAAIIASLLGVLQSWGDRRLESRALLLHRNIMPRDAFTAKFLAGLLMHCLATLPPLIFAAGWIAIDGRQTFAAYWDEMLPVMAYTLLAFMCWPACYLVVQREAWWIGSRLFPLPSAVWILAFSVMVTDAAPGEELVWVLGNGLAVLFAVTLTVAACNAFVSLGQLRGAPRVALSFLHGSSLLVGVMVLAGAVQQYYIDRENKAVISTVYQVSLGQDGEPMLTETEYHGDRSIVEVAKMSTEGSVIDKLGGTRELDYLPSWYLAQNPWRLASLNAGSKPFQILGTLGRKISQPARVERDAFSRGRPVSELLAIWTYVLDRRSGKILVYSEDSKLAHEMTPEKATGAMRFGELADNMAWNSNAYFMTSSTSSLRPDYDNLVVPFEDAVYVLENDGKTVTRFFDMPKDSPLIASSQRNHFGTGIVDRGLRFRDRLVLIHPQQPEHDATAELTTVGPITYDQTTIPLPRALANAPLIQLGQLPGSRNELVALTSIGADEYHWYRLNTEGEILEEKTYHQPTPSTGRYTQSSPKPWLVTLVPVGAIGLLTIVALCYEQGLNLIDWSYWTANPAASIAFLVLLVLQIVVAVAGTYGICRYLRLSKTITRRWIIASLLGGPFVALGLLTVYPRITTQVCVACRKRCRADRGECEYCHQSLDQPSRRGIEIFDNEPMPRLEPQAV